MIRICVKIYFNATQKMSFNTIVYNSGHLFHNSLLACTNLLLDCLKNLVYDSRFKVY